MSAFVVADKDIQMIVGYAARMKTGNWPFKSCEDLDSICSLLLNENIKSVNYRYREEEEEQTLKYDSKWSYSKLISHASAVKAVRYYQYQACEHPEWESSEAKRLTDEIKEYAVDMFLSENKEFQAAADPWLLQI